MSDSTDHIPRYTIEGEQRKIIQRLTANVATLLEALNVFSGLNHDCKAPIHGPVECDFCNAWEQARAAIAQAEKE